MNADQQGIVPLALAHNLDVCLAIQPAHKQEPRQINQHRWADSVSFCAYGTGREKICKDLLRRGV